MVPVCLASVPISDGLESGDSNSRASCRTRRATWIFGSGPSENQAHGRRIAKLLACLPRPPQQRRANPQVLRERHSDRRPEPFDPLPSIAAECGTHRSCVLQGERASKRLRRPSGIPRATGESVGGVTTQPARRCNTLRRKLYLSRAAIPAHPVLACASCLFVSNVMVSQNLADEKQICEQRPQMNGRVQIVHHL